MWSHKAEGEIDRLYIENVGVVVDRIVPVLSGNLLLCEVRLTNFQETFSVLLY